MTTYLIPTDDATIEAVARAIAKNRLHEDASGSMEKLIGVPLTASEKLESTFDALFETLWSGNTEVDKQQRAFYRGDARAAINAINLRLVTSS